MTLGRLCVAAVWIYQMFDLEITYTRLTCYPSSPLHNLDVKDPADESVKSSRMKLAWVVDPAVSSLHCLMLRTLCWSRKWDYIEISFSNWFAAKWLLAVCTCISVIQHNFALRHVSYCRCSDG